MLFANCQAMFCAKAVATKFASTIVAFYNKQHFDIIFAEISAYLLKICNLWYIIVLSNAWYNLHVLGGSQSFALCNQRSNL